MNTALHYIHRDGSNYKNSGRSVFSGEITTNLQRAFRAALDEGRYFIADQVDVPELFFTFGDDSVEDDHCWHEFSAFVVTHHEQTDSRTIQQFVGDVVGASGEKWKTFGQSKGQRHERRDE
jgi:hypothetical protein